VGAPLELQSTTSNPERLKAALFCSPGARVKLDHRLAWASTRAPERALTSAHTAWRSSALPPPPSFLQLLAPKDGEPRALRLLWANSLLLAGLSTRGPKALRIQLCVLLAPVSLRSSTPTAAPEGTLAAASRRTSSGSLLAQQMASPRTFLAEPESSTDLAWLEAASIPEPRSGA
jgi:hypothetical protein